MTWAHFHRKGGKHYEMPAHHLLEADLERCPEDAGLADQRKPPPLSFGRGPRGHADWAIVMSGAGIRMAEHERATKLADAVLAELGLRANQLDQLQALPFERLLAAIGPAQKKLAPPGFRLLDRYGFGPVVDGRDLPHHPFDPTATDLSDDMPVMAGGTKDENAIFVAPDDLVWNRTLSEDQLKTRIAELAPGDTDAVLALYRPMHPGMNPAELLIEITTDAKFWGALSAAC